MTNRKNAKRALVFSVLAILLCAAMLLGVTFAWFTDTASNSVNKIQAGTLDVKLQMATEWNDDGSVKTWTDAEGESLEFRKAAGAATGEAVLWEPGCTYKLPELKIVNNGSLALKYKIQITGIKGDAKLNEAIDWTMQLDNANETLGTEHSLAARTVNGESVTYDADIFTISGTMKTTAGNEYQGLSIDGISITVAATQDAVEYDSNDNLYDKDATYLNTDIDGTILIGSAKDLRYFAATVNADNDAYAGKTIKLTSDIDLGGAEWTPIHMAGTSSENKVTFDGNGKTISNFKVNDTDGKKYTGFFSVANFSDIKNLTVDNATVTGINHVGAIVGHGMVTSIDNCTVKDSSITTAVYNSDDGDKAGAIIGWMDEGICNITNCTVDNCTITGYRDIAGLVGYYGTTGGVGSVTGNTVKDTTVVQDLKNGYQSETPTTVREIVGRLGDGFTLDTNTNTATNVNITTINQ